MTNNTHNPELGSWVDTATGHQDFPIQNLPYGVFARDGASEGARVGVAIGDFIFDVFKAGEAGLFNGPAARAAHVCGRPALNGLMSFGTQTNSQFRARISEMLSDRASDEDRKACEPFLIPMDDCELRLPVEIGDYTDFYASIYHATNVGRMFRPDNPLLPNYKHIPIAYHGRSSSIVVSNTPIRRPVGQMKLDEDDAPTFAPCRLLDHELELGFFVGAGNAHGKSVPIGDARDHIFGLCIVNDWSARDIQKWEYQPLGPFLSKSFATTISPWIVTLEALEPFRIPAFEREDGDPGPLPYLADSDDLKSGGLDVTVEAELASRQMREKGLEPMRLSRGNFRDMYWTIAQMLTHHSSGGCNLRPGDLMASGTISGRSEDSRGCMLELTARGSKPVKLPTGEERKFLMDGDELTLRAFCEREGAARIGFGECIGVVEAALF